MRGLAVLALLATASLSGCFWWSGEWSSSQSHMNDPFSDGGPWVVLAVLLVVGGIVVAINLSGQSPPAPPSPPTPPIPPQAPPTPPAPSPPHKAAATKSSKPRRPTP